MVLNQVIFLACRKTTSLRWVARNLIHWQSFYAKPKRMSASSMIPLPSTMQPRIGNHLVGKTAVRAFSALPVIFFLNIFNGLGVSGMQYSTVFPLNENPISESGNWINDGTVGLDWTNVATASGLVHGT